MRSNKKSYAWTEKEFEIAQYKIKDMTRQLALNSFMLNMDLESYPAYTRKIEYSINQIKGYFGELIRTWSDLIKAHTVMKIALEKATRGAEILTTEEALEKATMTATDQTADQTPPGTTLKAEKKTKQ